MVTLKGISEAYALRHLAEEEACPAAVDREQLASLGSDLLARGPVRSSCRSPGTPTPGVDRGLEILPANIRT